MAGIKERRNWMKRDLEGEDEERGHFDNILKHLKEL